MIRFVSVLLPVLLATSAMAQTATPRNYAQSLVDREVAWHPDIVVLALHVKPPKAPDTVMIASNIGRVGKKADEDDMGVITTGQPKLSVNKAGDRYESLLPLLDANHRLVGCVGVVYAYRLGDDKTALTNKAIAVRDEMARRISHAGNLVESAVADATIPTQTYGQHLVDTALDQHPEIAILALHVVPPHRTDNVIVASNIGRIGKKADEDDMAVINTGTPKLEMNETNDRFEVEQRLLDLSGDTLGAVGVVFPYKPGDDKNARHDLANTVAVWLSKRISNAGNLLEPFPYDPKFSGDHYAQKIVDTTVAANPDAIIMAIHGTPPGSAQNVIIASNIGRIGKKADEDDMGVINSGKRLLEVNKERTRLEVELQLHDTEGKTVGALSLCFRYKAGDDKEAFHQKAEAIKTAVEKQIPSAAKLFEPAA